MTLQRGLSVSSRRASTVGPLAAFVTFLVVLALVDQGCRRVDADCNPASFLVLPVVALFGLPVMMVLFALILLPIWRCLARRGQPGMTPFVILGLLPAVLLGGWLLAFVGIKEGAIPAMLGFIAIGLGLPSLVGTVTFYRIMRATR
jgi:hypothetical protein